MRRERSKIITASAAVIGAGLVACGHTASPTAPDAEGTGATAQAITTCSVDQTLADAVTQSGPVAVSRQPGSLDVFYKGGTTGTVKRRTLRGDRKTWSAEEDNLGAFFGKPGVASWSQHTPNADRLDVFVRGLNNGLWHRWYENGQWMNGWEGLGGTMASSPTVSSWGDGRLDIFYTTADTALRHRRWDSSSPGWSIEDNLGTAVKGDPAAVSWGSGRIDVVVRGTNDRLYHKWYDGSWHDYEGLGGSVLASSPTIASWAPGRLDIFYLSGSAPTLKHRAFGTNGWEDEEDLGGLTNGAGGATKYAGDPSAVSIGDSRIDVLVNDDKNHLVRRSWYGANARLKPLDCTAGTATVVAGKWRGSMILEDSGFAAGGGEVALPNLRIPVTALASDANAPPTNAQPAIKAAPWVLLSDPSGVVTPSGKVLVTGASGFASYTDDYVVPTPHANGDTGALRARIRVDAANPPAITAGKLTGRFFVDVPITSQPAAYPATGIVTAMATQTWSFVLDRSDDLSTAQACTASSQCGANAACDTRVGLCSAGAAGVSSGADAVTSVTHGLASAWPTTVDGMINTAATGNGSPWFLDPNDRSENGNNRIRDFYRVQLPPSYDWGVKYSYVVDRAALYSQANDLAYKICLRDFTSERIGATLTESAQYGARNVVAFGINKTGAYTGGCVPTVNPDKWWVTPADLCGAIYDSPAVFSDTGTSCNYYTAPHVFRTRWRKTYLPCVEGVANDPATTNLGEGPINFNCSSFHSTVDSWNNEQTTYATFLRQRCVETEVDMKIVAPYSANDPRPQTRKIYICNMDNALSGVETKNGTAQFGPFNNWEWMGCWDPTGKPPGSSLFDSHSFNRLFGGALAPGAVSNDAMCGVPVIDANRPATAYAPYTFPLFSHNDGPGGATANTMGKALLDECASELAISPTESLEIKKVFDPSRQCISTPRFFTSLRDASLASNLAYFNHLVQQWLQMSSFLANQGVQGAELLAAVVDDMRTDVAPPGPLEDANKLVAQLDDAMDLVLDHTFGPKLVAAANAGDYRRTEEYWAGATLGNADDAGTNMAIVLAETAKSYLVAVEQVIAQVANDVTGRCGEIDVPAKMATLQQRAGRSLRYAAAMSGLANAIAAASDSGHLDGTRWEHARRLLASQRQRVVDKAADVSACKSPSGSENDDVPIYWSDQLTNVSRFFAGSEYFRQQAITEVGVSQKNLDNARQAWIEWRNSHLQSLAQENDMSRRVADIETHYAEPIIEACGMSNMDPTIVIDAFGGGQGSYAPETCYVPAGVACASATDASCYRGTMGEAALAIVGARADVAIAQKSWQDAQAAYDTQAKYCIQVVEPDANRRILLAADHQNTLNDLQTQKMWADGIAAALDEAKDCSNAATLAFSFGSNCVEAMGATIAKVASIGIQKEVDTENNHYAQEMADMEARATTAACFHEADMRKIGVDTARDQIGRRLIEVQANLLRLQNLQRHVRELVSEGRAARARELARAVPSVEFHYWLNEKIDTFQQQFGWAKHVAYLAVKSVEWDYQESLPDLRKAVMQATTPAQLTNKALIPLGAITLSKKINNNSPGKTQVGVFSMVSDILKLGDRTGSGGRNAVGRFRDMISSPAGRIYDVDGNWVGQGIRFTFGKSLTAPDRCAERLWRVMAAYVGDGVTTDGGKIGLRVAKRNTFSSRWCAGHGTAGTDQVGVSTGISYFFGGHASMPTAGMSSWNAASVDAINSPSKVDFANIDFHNGSSEELAGRGLFGDYIVYIPVSQLSKVSFPALEDIYLRLDYEDIDNSQLGAILHH